MTLSGYHLSMLFLIRALIFCLLFCKMIQLRRFLKHVARITIQNQHHFSLIKQPLTLISVIAAIPQMMPKRIILSRYAFSFLVSHHIKFFFSFTRLRHRYSFIFFFSLHFLLLLLQTYVLEKIKKDTDEGQSFVRKKKPLLYRL